MKNKIDHFLVKVVNKIFYGKFVGCAPHDWQPIGFADFKCTKCGVER